MEAESHKRVKMRTDKLDSLPQNQQEQISRAQAALSKESILQGSGKMDTFRLSQQKFRGSQTGGMSAASSSFSQTKDIEEILLNNPVNKPKKRFNPLGQISMKGQMEGQLPMQLASAQKMTSSKLAEQPDKPQSAAKLTRGNPNNQSSKLIPKN